MNIRIVLGVMLGAGCGSPADDLNAICEEATKLQAGQPPYAELDPYSRMTVFADTVDSRLKTKLIRGAFTALAAASPEERYQLLQDVGKEAGVDDWQCPALELWSKSED